jgi:carboxymethylenebutenolidase
VSKIDVQVPTPDGTAPASLFTPDGSGPWPGVIMYPDAGGVRDVFDQMAGRLAGTGLAVLLPDVYYRAGDHAPFSADTAFTDPDERARMASLTAMLTGDRIATDAMAWADFLGTRAEVADGPLGTTGYCMGGRLALLAAGHLGERVGAAASYHGGNLAPEGEPDSPVAVAGAVRAVVYVAAAADDPWFPVDQVTRLGDAYAAAGVDHTIDTYPAGHGFAVADNPTFDVDAAERHWSTMTSLFASALG